jgi:uncharacterized membrane protein
MKIRTRLTLLFTLITAMLLGIYSFSIYYSSKEARETSLRRAANEAIAKADLYFQSSLPEQEMHKLYKNNNRTLNEVQVAIYDNNQLIYHDDAKVDYVKKLRKCFPVSFRKRKSASFWMIYR